MDPQPLVTAAARATGADWPAVLLALGERCELQKLEAWRKSSETDQKSMEFMSCGGFHEDTRGTPIAGWFIRENPIYKMDDWGYPHVWKPPCGMVGRLDGWTWLDSGLQGLHASFGRAGLPCNMK